MEDVNEEVIRDRVRAHVERAGSLRKLAKEWNVSAAFLSNFLNGISWPTEGILEPLGLRREVSVRYVPGSSKGQRKRHVRAR